jgi:hypothetical protein
MLIIQLGIFPMVLQILQMKAWLWPSWPRHAGECIVLRRAKLLMELLIQLIDDGVDGGRSLVKIVLIFNDLVVLTSILIAIIVHLVFTWMVVEEEIRHC